MYVLYKSSLLLFHPFRIDEKKETDFGQDCHPSSYSKILQFSGASSKLPGDNALNAPCPFRPCLAAARDIRGHSLESKLKVTPYTPAQKS